MADHGQHGSHTSPLPPVPPAGGPRKLVRRPEDGHVAGVCSGVAEYFNVDPLIVRIAALALLFSGPGFFAYLAAWVFVPAADGSMLVEQVKPIPQDKTTQIVGIGLIVLAISLVFGGWWAPTREYLWPVGLIAVGAWLLLRRKDDEGGTPTPPPPAGPPTPWTTPDPTSVVPAPPAPAGTTEPTATDVAEADVVERPAPDAPATDAPDDADATTTSSSDDLPTSVFAGLAAGDREGGGPPHGPDDTSAWAVPPVPPVPPIAGARRRKRFLGPLVFGALLVWAGIASVAGVSLDDGLAVGLCILGAGFLLGAFVGGTRALVLPALLAAAALFATTVIDIPWRGGIGHARWEVSSLSDLKDEYERAIGQGVLALGELDLRPGQRAEVVAHLGVGELVVEVPEGHTIDLRGDIGAGEAEVLGRSSDGVGVDLDRTIRGDADHGTIELDLHVGLGHLEVREVPAPDSARAA